MLEKCTLFRAKICCTTGLSDIITSRGMDAPYNKKTQGYTKQRKTRHKIPISLMANLTKRTYLTDARIVDVESVIAKMISLSDQVGMWSARSLQVFYTFWVHPMRSVAPSPVDKSWIHPCMPFLLWNQLMHLTECMFRRADFVSSFSRLLLSRNVQECWSRLGHGVWLAYNGPLTKTEEDWETLKHMIG